jgi:hypothetical protein
LRSCLARVTAAASFTFASLRSSLACPVVVVVFG